MPSHYDEKKKCRIGIMDEQQFYSESDQTNGAYFRDLLKAWAKAGGTLRWGAGGVGLRMALDGQEVGVCFLAPAYAGKKNRIELGCSALRKQLGVSCCDELVAALREAAGDRVAGAFFANPCSIAGRSYCVAHTFELFSCRKAKAPPLKASTATVSSR